MLAVIWHYGKMSNVTMEPGDMVLYESYSVIHGRHFPLKRRYYAHIFIHFEPTGHSLCHNAKVEPESNVHEKYHEATSSSRAPFLVTPEIEAKLVHDGINERPLSRQLRAQSSEWRYHKLGHGIGKNHKSFECAGWEWFDPYTYAWKSTWWTHEDCEFLQKNGADVNVWASAGAGGTPLWWGKEWAVGFDYHPTVSFVESVGALYLNGRYLGLDSSPMANGNHIKFVSIPLVGWYPSWLQDPMCLEFGGGCKPSRYHRGDSCTCW